MQLTPKEKRDLKIGLPIAVVVSAAFLIPCDRSRRDGTGSLDPLARLR